MRNKKNNMNYSKAYRETIGAYNKLGKSYLKNIERLIPKQIYNFIELMPPNGKILDVGCAGGRDSKEFAEKGFSVIGIDLVEEFLKEARKNVSKAKFAKMDLLNLKFPKNSFDGIWASAVLVHIGKKDARTALSGFYKILKPKGKIFVAVKMGEGSFYIADKLSKEKRLFVYFSKKEIEELLKSAGFNIKKTWVTTDDAKRKEVKWVIIIAEKK